MCGWKMTDILDHSVGIEEFIGNAIGAASMCWADVEKAGIFDSERAVQLIEEVLDYLAVLLPVSELVFVVPNRADRRGNKKRNTLVRYDRSGKGGPKTMIVK